MRAVMVIYDDCHAFPISKRGDTTMRYDYYVYSIMVNTKPGPFVYGDYEFRYLPIHVGVGCENQDYAKLCEIRRQVGPNIFVEKYFEGITEEQATEALRRMLEKIELGTKNDTNSPLLKEQAADDTNSSENKCPYDWTGKFFSDEHRKSISDSLKGHVYPESRNKKISENMTGKPQPWNDGNENSALSWIVSSPSGQISMINNLAKFCEKMGLNVSNLRMVAEHLRDHHKGWKCKRGNLIGWNK